MEETIRVTGRYTFWRDVLARCEPPTARCWSSIFSVASPDAWLSDGL
jgi:hypothetical protein